MERVKPLSKRIFSAISCLEFFFQVIARLFINVVYILEASQILIFWKKRISLSTKIYTQRLKFAMLPMRLKSFTIPFKIWFLHGIEKG